MLHVWKALEILIPIMLKFVKVKILKLKHVSISIVFICSIKELLVWKIFILFGHADIKNLYKLSFICVRVLFVYFFKP